MKKTIEKFPDYSITENGVIYDKNNKRVKTFINAAGYVAARLNDRIVTVAYLVAKTWLKNDDKCICVGYKDNDYSNVKASNLYWYYEGEEMIEDKAVILVDADGELIHYFPTLLKCVEYYDSHKSTIITKCLFHNKNVTSDCYFFFEEEYDEDELKKRVEYRLNKRKQAEHNRQVAALKRAEEYKVKPRLKPISMPVVEFDIDGNIIREYKGKYQMMDELNWSYSKMSRIIERDGIYEGHYFLLKKDYDRINPLEFIRIVNEREKEKEERRQQLIKQRELEIKKRERQRTIRGNATKSLMRAIQQYTMEGEYLRTYYNKLDITSQGFVYNTIFNCCKSKYGTTSGYRWTFDGESLKQLSKGRMRAIQDKMAKESINNKDVINS